MKTNSEKTDATIENETKRNEKQGRLKDYSVILASTIVILGGIHCARSILGPIFIAAFFSALLISPVRWLRSKGVAQWLALTVVVIGVLAIGLATMTVVGSQLTQFAKNIPIYRDEFNQKLINYNLNVDDFLPFLKNDEPAKSENGDVANSEEQIERIREYERERARREIWNERFDRSNGTDDQTPPTKNLDASARTEASAQPRVGETKTFFTRVARRVPNEISVEFDDSARAVASETAAKAVAPPSTELKAATSVSAESGAAANESADSALDVGLLPQATAAESRLTPGENGAAEARLIPSPPEPLLGSDEIANDETSQVAAAANAETPSKQVAAEEKTEGILVETEDSAGSDLAASETVGATSEKDAADSDVDNSFEWRAKDGAVNAVSASSQELFRFLGGLVGELSYLASNAFIITLLVIFMLCEATATPQKLVAALGKRRFTNTHIQNVADDIRNYMVIKTWMSVGVGVSVTILLIVSDVQYPLLWGFVAFLLNYIPNIGSVAAAIPPVVLATVEHGLFVGCVDAAFFVFINCFIGYVIEPRLLGNGLDLSPLIVLISLVLCGWLLGPIGMFLSPPLAVIIKIIVQSFPETRWIAALMANRPPKEPVIDDETPDADSVG